ncbi:5-formyltetrahydrofolate cyclo-ligase [Desulfovibrionales bacterium]
MDTPGDKQTIRTTFLAWRQMLDPAIVREHSERIQWQVLALSDWITARTVLLYMPFRNEVNTGTLLNAAWAAGKQVFLPRCRPNTKNCLELVCVTDLTVIQPGAYGIHEPDQNICPADKDYIPDLVAVPAVAFDRCGFRLGYGGGYYDRYLAGLPRTTHETSRTVGLAYSFQILDRIPADPWDQPINILATEEELIWI